MKKIAIFVEGHCGLVFVRRMLLLLFDNSKLSFDCCEWRSRELGGIPYPYRPPDPEIYFLIIDAAGDQAVLSAIKEREKGLFEKGYDGIIGVRDMYSEAYIRRAGRTIDNGVTTQFLEGWHQTIDYMSEPAKIKLHISIMELEAWFLGMYELFPELDASLSMDAIKSQLGFDLETCDPQTDFFHPSKVLSDIFQLMGAQYRKSQDDIERICSKIKMSDFADATENGRCACFRKFQDEILKWQRV